MVMRHLSISDKLKISAWTMATRTLFVLAVVLLSLLLGISVLTGLVIVSVVLVVFALASIWIPADRPGRRFGPPRSPSGDRYPRRPSPFRPSSSVERPLPGA